MSARARIAAGALLGSALGLTSCGVPEQALRDEQSRSRKFRDAYESEHEENAALKARLQQQEKAACPAGAPAVHP